MIIYDHSLLVYELKEFNCLFLSSIVWYCFLNLYYCIVNRGLSPLADGSICDTNLQHKSSQFHHFLSLYRCLLCNTHGICVAVCVYYNLLSWNGSAVWRQSWYHIVFLNYLRQFWQLRQSLFTFVVRLLSIVF